VNEDRIPNKVFNMKVKEKRPTGILRSGCEEQIRKILHRRKKGHGK
jgi:hypothetical protein